MLRSATAPVQMVHVKGENADFKGVVGRGFELSYTTKQG